MRVLKVVGLMVFSLFAFSTQLFAGDNDVQETILQMQERIEALENKSSGTEFMQGIELGVGGTMIVQGVNNVNHNGDGATLKDSRADGSYSADVTLEKEFEEVGGAAFLHLEAGQGSGIEDNLVLYSNVNRDAGDSEAKVEVTEFWYEQGLFEEKLAVTFGKLDPTSYFDNQ